ncbi:dihydrofolate reductase family protein [Smaragdicoccus niigatensis]|uniref:dihydrofolate reductase family protein n=1 Tax=Smaragdicoccus niigatensis TaxID=359359 RepID=UPI0003A537E1|nr:dihydrofolate reductase family protein [Smaragdicoccus niigatensis]
MRKIIVISMISLDGVLQAPGGRDEDTSGAFQYGGWTASYFDEVFEAAMAEDLKPANYLLGRKTFDIWEQYWPKHADFWPGINDGMKYVVSTTITRSDWANTTFLTCVDDIEELKKSDGTDIHVWGSGQLIQLLLEHDWVDELRLKIYPMTLGSGKKLFAEGTIPAAMKLTDSTATPSGVILANYQRAGDVETGNVGP